MAKKQKANQKQGPAAGKPLAIVIVGIGVALAVAIFLSQGGSEAPIADEGVDTPMLSTDGAHVRGPENARVRLVEFGDYQCPTCAAYHNVVDELFRRFGDDLALEFHHMPLVSIHPNSMAASLAAEAAGEQGQFWEMHDMIFENQPSWAGSPNPEALFISYAGRLGLDQDRFMQAMRDSELEARVLRDVTRARELEIQAVPTFFIDGRRLPLPRGVDEFEQVIRTVIDSR